MKEETKEDLKKFSKEQLIKIIKLCDDANKYRLAREFERTEQIKELQDRIDKAIEILQDYDLVENKDKVISDTFKALRGEDNE